MQLTKGDRVMVRLTRYTDRRLATLARDRSAEFIGETRDGLAIVEFIGRREDTAGERFYVRPSLLTRLPAGTTRLTIPQVPVPFAFAERDEGDRHREYRVSFDGRGILLADRHA